MARTYRLASLLVVLGLFFGAIAAFSQQVLIVRQVSLTSPARPGTDPTIVVATASNAVCTITVIYKSGPSRAQGLIPKTADAQGQSDLDMARRDTDDTRDVADRCQLFVGFEIGETGNIV